MVVNSDCLVYMKTMPDNSVDAIVTDPPYGLSFMGKKWDYDVPSQEIWKECLRVLKPGGYLLAFAGTRTQHRMAVRIEDAGFEIRDMIFYTYGSGFPKSTNIYKQLKKKCTCGNMELYEQDRNVQRIPSEQNTEHDLRPMSETNIPQEINTEQKQGKVLQSGLSEQSLSLSGNTTSNDGSEQSSVERGSNTKENSRELSGDNLSEMSKGISTDGEERRIHNATQISNGSTLEQIIDQNGSSPSSRPQSEKQQYREPCAFCKQYGTQAMGAFGFGSALKPACEPITVARKPISEKNLADNYLKWGVGGINIDGSRVGTEHMGGGTMPDLRDVGDMSKEAIGIDKLSCGQNPRPALRKEQPTYTGRFPANLIHDGSDEVVGLFPNTKSVSSKGHFRKGNVIGDNRTPVGAGQFGDGAWIEGSKHNDSGSAARFFMTCKYTPNDAIMKLCEDNIYANNAENSLPITNLIEQVVNIYSVLKSVPPNLDLLNQSLNALYAEKKPKNTVIDFVAKLVAISEVPEDLVSQEELIATQDFISNLIKCSQNQNCVDVEKWENINIIQIIINLLKLSGYVLLATDENTNSERKEVVGENGEPKRFLYTPKASKSERNKGLEELETKQTVGGGGGIGNYLNDVNSASGKFGSEKAPAKNNHPTVKPIALMEYLVKLVSKEGHTVLDPFCGSGSTGIACKKLNREFIGIELDADYCKIAEARINVVKKEPEQLTI